MQKLKAIWVWIVSLFAIKQAVERIQEQEIKPEAQPEIKPEPETESAKDEPNTAMAPTPRRRGKTRDQIKSLGQLLDSMDEVFRLYAIPYSKYSWITRSESTGLRKLGAHIQYSNTELTNARVVPTKGLPGMFIVSAGWSRFDGENTVYPAMMFGIKVRSLPTDVDKHKGVAHYKFGAGYRMGIDSVNDPNRELFWVAGYMTVNDDGTLYLHDERNTELKVIRVKSASQRRIVGSKVTVPVRRWMPASIARAWVDETHPLHVMREMAITEFALSVNWWMKRDERWNVIVKKDGERVTFGIEKKLTKDVFRDRIKIKTPSGATKPIFHYVSAHSRVNGAEVREHVRGLDEFNWKGYGCKITAPKLGNVTTQFELSSIEFDSAEIPSGFIDVSKVGQILAEFEEQKLVRN